MFLYSTRGHSLLRLRREAAEKRYRCAINNCSDGETLLHIPPNGKHSEYLVIRTGRCWSAENRMSLLGGGGGIGDIWSTGAFSFESPLKDLLDSGDYTIEQLLSQDELLQELRGVHPQLIQFFSTPEALTKLVEFVIQPPAEKVKEEKPAVKKSETVEANGDVSPSAAAPQRPRDPGEWLKRQKEAKSNKSKTPQDDPEMRNIRFPYMSCEVICCEIQSIIDVLVDGRVPDPTDPAKTETTTEGSKHPATTQTTEKCDNDGTPAADAATDTAADAATDTAAEATTTSETANDNTQPSNSRKGTRLLDLLFSLLYETEPGKLDDYRAGYFEKMLTVLFRKRPTELSEYVNNGGGKGAETLMRTMFQHLYSHSIMQIAQRLLLPPRPTPPKQQPEEGGGSGDGGGGDEQEQVGAEIVSEETDPMQDNNVGIQCDWSKSNTALELLLDILIDPHVPDGAKSEEIEEQLLDLSLNASEVLITIIQNSMLSSETMLALTSSKTIERLVVAATTLRCAEGEEEYFSPHESLLTSAMNVLESLVLQLGGYGAVGTMFLLPEKENEGDELETDFDEQHLIADLTSMVDHLPMLLDSLAKLLLHPSTKTWSSPMQFSKTTPQFLLGSSRLRIVRVLESLVLLGDPEVDSKLIQSDCLEICLDMFWEFQWCSMLHQSVANLLVHIFEGQNSRIEMQEYFLVKCNLLGRLMDSFLEVRDTSRITEVVMNLKDINLNTAASVESEKGGSSADPLPVSEDDVDAALEKQQEAEMSAVVEPSSLEAAAAKVLTDPVNVELVSTEAVRFESRDASTIGLATPGQAFRFGYMGHVIIICQALVHACSTELEQEEEQLQQLENGEQIDSAADGEMSSEPLLLAELIADHVLCDKWSEFVSTTLASETAIQSSPLGGYSGEAPESLHSHRPGLADDGDILGDDGMGPPAPPRGMLGGGDFIDMDDNDLEIAANMMANLGLTRSTVDVEDVSSNDSGSASGDSEKSYNSGETAKDRSGYAFDDPLGKAGALGIELGKLTQYKEGEDDAPDTKAMGGNSDDGSHSSSDEEPERSDSGEVPVMDLFAGNFDSNFANFEQAEDSFGDFESAAPVTPPLAESDSKSSDLDDIFGKGDHASLLEEDDSPVTSEESAPQDPMMEPGPPRTQPIAQEVAADSHGILESESPESEETEDAMKDDARSAFQSAERVEADEGAEPSWSC